MSYKLKRKYNKKGEFVQPRKWKAVGGEPTVNTQAVRDKHAVGEKNVFKLRESVGTTARKVLMNLLRLEVWPFVTLRELVTQREITFPAKQRLNMLLKGWCDLTVNAEDET